MKKASIILLSLLLGLVGFYFLSHLIYPIEQFIVNLIDVEWETRTLISSIISLLTEAIIFGIFIAIMSARKAIRLKGASLAGASLLLVAAILSFCIQICYTILAIGQAVETHWWYNLTMNDTLSNIYHILYVVGNCLNVIFLIGMPLLVIPTKIPVLGKVVMSLFYALLLPTYTLLSRHLYSWLQEIDWKEAYTYIYNGTILCLIFPIFILVLVSLIIAKKRKVEEETPTPTIVA